MSEEFYLESVYDEEVYPLMKQIIEICTTHKLPFAAVFQFETNEDGEHGLCSSAFLPNDRPLSPVVEEIYETMHPKRFRSITITTRNKDGEATHIEKIVT